MWLLIFTDLWDQHMGISEPNFWIISVNQIWVKCLRAKHHRTRFYDIKTGSIWIYIYIIIYICTYIHIYCFKIIYLIVYVYCANRSVPYQRYITMHLAWSGSTNSQYIKLGWLITFLGSRRRNLWGWPSWWIKISNELRSHSHTQVEDRV